jgi:DNA ligase (NAD+)
LLRSPADLYKLKKAGLLGLERVGDKLATKLLDQVESHRQLQLSVFLRALGIEELDVLGGLMNRPQTRPEIGEGGFETGSWAFRCRHPLLPMVRGVRREHLGKHVSAIMEEKYETIERVREVTSAELAAIHTIGDVTAEKVVSGLKENAVLIDALLAEVRLAGPKPVSSEPPTGPLAGQSVVFTGKLLAFDRKSAQKLVVEAGGETPSGVTKTLDMLVIGDGKEGKKAANKSKQKSCKRPAVVSK